MEIILNIKHFLQRIKALLILLVLGCLYGPVISAQEYKHKKAIEGLEYEFVSKVNAKSDEKTIDIEIDIRLLTPAANDASVIKKWVVKKLSGNGSKLSITVNTQNQQPGYITGIQLSASLPNLAADNKLSLKCLIGGKNGKPRNDVELLFDNVLVSKGRLDRLPSSPVPLQSSDAKLPAREPQNVKSNQNLKGQLEAAIKVKGEKFAQFIKSSTGLQAELSDLRTNCTNSREDLLKAGTDNCIALVSLKELLAGLSNAAGRLIVQFRRLKSDAGNLLGTCKGCGQLEEDLKKYTKEMSRLEESAGMLENNASSLLGDPKLSPGNLERCAEGRIYNEIYPKLTQLDQDLFALHNKIRHTLDTLLALGTGAGKQTYNCDSLWLVLDGLEAEAGEKNSLLEAIRKLYREKIAAYSSRLSTGKVEVIEAELNDLDKYQVNRQELFKQLKTRLNELNCHQSSTAIWPALVLGGLLLLAGLYFLWRYYRKKRMESRIRFH